MRKGLASDDAGDFVRSLEPESSVETIANAAASVVVNCECADPADALSRAVQDATTRELQKVFGPAPDGGLQRMLDAAAGVVH